MTKTIRVELGARSYEVVVGNGVAADVLFGVLASKARGIHWFIDAGVAETQSAALEELERIGYASRTELPAGEKAKTLAVVENACSRLVEHSIERGDLIVGVGGGATTDVAGFVAAVVLRGVDYVSIPTTLLAQVDAAVGGKTAVNLPEGKNLVGAFHQPRAVACDLKFLETLAVREFRAGLAEVVKTAWLGAPDLFEMLEAGSPPSASSPELAEIVARCVEVKARIVSDDETEAGARATLNFGHTIGHAIETWGQGRYLHGEAVSLGLVAALYLSVASGRCSESDLDRMVALLQSMGLPVHDSSLDPTEIAELTTRDKKRAGARDRYILTEGLGQVSVATDLVEGAPRAALEFLTR